MFVLEYYDYINKDKIMYLLRELKYFLIEDYGMGMKRIINDILKERYTTYNDYNYLYQEPLHFLYKTKKFDDIKFINGKYYTPKLKNLYFIINKEGKWDIMNKLNSNYNVISRILADIIFITKEEKNFLKFASNIEDRKRWLCDFKKKYDIHTLIKKNINLEEYAEHLKRISIDGSKSENIVIQVIKSKGYNILYKAQDGDPIDMRYGVDVIIEKNNKIYLLQVKNNIKSAKDAFLNPKYPGIDWYCAPLSTEHIIIYSNDEFNNKIMSKRN